MTVKASLAEGEWEVEEKRKEVPNFLYHLSVLSWNHGKFWDRDIMCS